MDEAVGTGEVSYKPSVVGFMRSLLPNAEDLPADLQEDWEKADSRRVWIIEGED